MSVSGGKRRTPAFEKEGAFSTVPRLILFCWDANWVLPEVVVQSPSELRPMHVVRQPGLPGRCFGF
jgi:hypothetical protein